jgi:hypothetical protein
MNCQEFNYSGPKGTKATRTKNEQSGNFFSLVFVGREERCIFVEDLPEEYERIDASEACDGTIWARYSPSIGKKEVSTEGHASIDDALSELESLLNQQHGEGFWWSPDTLLV